MEREKKQIKVFWFFFCSKKMETISRAWCFMEHAEKTVSWNPEASSGVLPHRAGTVDTLCFFLCFWTSATIYFLVSLFLFLFSPSVSCKLTPLLHFVSLPFTLTLVLSSAFSVLMATPTCPQVLTHDVDILSHTPVPTYFLYFLASTELAGVLCCQH